MIRFALLFTLFTLLLFGASKDYAILKESSHLSSSKNKSEIFRAYNNYKNLYLRSMMNEDSYLRMKSLEGIIKTGTKLHIDIDHYLKELSKIKKQKRITSINHKGTLDKRKKIKSKAKAIVVLRYKLEYARWNDDVLRLKFNRKLERSHVHSFNILEPKKGVFKYVFDIHNAMLDHAHSLHHSRFLHIRLAQYKPSIIRLVLQSKKATKIDYDVRDDTLIIRLHNSIKRSKKQKRIIKENIQFRPAPPKRLDRNEIIVIDPGHGGKDPGAIGYKHYREKNIVIEIAKELKSILESRGYKVYMTRDRDYFVKLRHRTKFANDRNAKIFVSIHANAVEKKHAKKAFGIETYFLAKSRTDRAKRVAQQENQADLGDMNYYGVESFLNTISSHNLVASNKLAIDMQRGILGALKPYYKNIHDGGVREGPFWVLVGAKMPSILVEVGFVTNPKEVQRLIDAKYQRRMALGMANGIERYFLNN